MDKQKMKLHMELNITLETNHRYKRVQRKMKKDECEIIRTQSKLHIPKTNTLNLESID